MTIDTPATIAILGAGPIGLEAALYARYLGYKVQVYERGRVAQNVRQWGHVRLFSPFGINRSPLGLAALAAQDEHYQPPGDDALLTGREYVERYLAPLAASDLLADSIHQQTTVVAVARRDLLKGELVGLAERGERPFRLLLREKDGSERDAEADVVVDASGTYGQPNWLGRGGAPAVGEAAAHRRIVYTLPDVLGDDRDQFAGRHTLVVGAGYSAATTVVALSQLAREALDTHVTWATRRAPAAEEAGPVPAIAEDRLPERAHLAAAAAACASDEDRHVDYWPASWIESVEWDASEERFVVELSGRHAGTHWFDRLVAQVGYRPDGALARELQVQLCYASEGPMKLAAALLGSGGGDCLDQQSHGPASLVTTEPNYYVLGSKSYGRNSQFLIARGLDQVRELFSLMTGREDLNLYASAATSPAAPTGS